MVGFQKIQALLTPSTRMTTVQVAKHIGLSVGHVRRVLHWMVRNHMAHLVAGSSPHLWTA